MSLVTPAATGAAVRRGLTQSRPDVRGTIFYVFLLLSLLFSLAVLAVLLLDVLSRAMPVFETRGLDFLTSPLSSDPSKAGIAQGLFGTIILALLVPIISFPFGIATAVYLEEYAPNNRLTRFIQINIRNLAGVPSIVYGLLGLAIFVAFFKSIGLGGSRDGRHLLAAALTLAVLVLPIVIITTAEALRAVPLTIREAGYGVGASRWEVTRKLVLPAAVPGILTGTVLALARALGETAPLLLIGGIVGGFSTPEGQSIVDTLTGSYTALPLTVFQWAKQPQEEFRQLAAAAIVVLLAVTLFANAVAVLLRNRFERNW
jgi:phosphate transport system permease protein